MIVINFEVHFDKNYNLRKSLCKLHFHSESSSQYTLFSALMPAQNQLILAEMVEYDEKTFFINSDQLMPFVSWYVNLIQTCCPVEWVVSYLCECFTPLCVHFYCSTADQNVEFGNHD